MSDYQEATIVDQSRRSHVRELAQRAATAELERDEARAQLAAATARVAVLDAALEDVLDDADKMDGWAHLTSSQIRTLLTDLDPLTAAVVRVVAAAREQRRRWSVGKGYVTKDFRDAVDALRALAPGLFEGRQK